MTRTRFEGTGTYVATDDLTMAVNAAVTLERPILVKGEPGTGKTQLAIEVASSLGKPLFEWHIKSTTKAQQGLYEYDAVARLRDSQLGDDKVHDIANYIVKGPLWEAFEQEVQPVLLIDELDRTDEPFEAYLLEVLADFQVTIPEIGTIKAPNPPIVVITSNRTREIHDALKRRCLYHWVDYPAFERELEILNARVPEATAALSAEIGPDHATSERSDAEDLTGLHFPTLAISATTGVGLDQLGPWLFARLGIVRIYTKAPGKPPDLDRPYTIRRGEAVHDVATLVHRELAATLKFARLWRPPIFDGQHVGPEHDLEDGDIIELHQ